MRSRSSRSIILLKSSRYVSNLHHTLGNLTSAGITHSDPYIDDGEGSFSRCLPRSGSIGP